jgi:hypothetical protein
LPTYIDLLSKERIDEEDILCLRPMRLPLDNWYPHDVNPDTHPAYQSSVGGTFALVDDGAGPRWFPVQMLYRELTCPICKGAHHEE